jgi:hypothetical protein
MLVLFGPMNGSMASGIDNQKVTMDVDMMIIAFLGILKLSLIM